MMDQMFNPQAMANGLSTKALTDGLGLQAAKPDDDLQTLLGNPAFATGISMLGGGQPGMGSQFDTNTLLSLLLQRGLIGGGSE